MSVIMRLGGRPCFFKRRINKRLAALVFAANLHDFVEHISVLVDSPPQPASPAIDPNCNLVEIPEITAGRWLSANAPGIAGTMSSAPSADGLIGYSDPAFQQHFLNVAQAERKPVIEPDSTGNDLWRETVVLVIGNGLVHATINIDKSLNPKQGDNTLALGHAGAHGAPTQPTTAWN